MSSRNELFSSNLTQNTKREHNEKYMSIHKTNTVMFMKFFAKLGPFCKKYKELKMKLRPKYSHG